MGRGQRLEKSLMADRKARVEVPHDPGRPHTAVANWRAMGSVRNDWQPLRLGGSFPGMGRAYAEDTKSGQGLESGSGKK